MLNLMVKLLAPTRVWKIILISLDCTTKTTLQYKGLTTTAESLNLEVSVANFNQLLVYFGLFIYKFNLLELTLSLLK